MIESNRYVIAVQNLEKSAAYYRDVLRFQIRAVGDPGWRFFVKDKCTIMAGECPGAVPASELGDHSYFAYIVISDVEGYYEAVKERGAEFVKHLRDEPWGMSEFGIRTPDGHRIMFGYPA